MKFKCNIDDSSSNEFYIVNIPLSHRNKIISKWNQIWTEHQLFYIVFYSVKQGSIDFL